MAVHVATENHNRVSYFSFVCFHVVQRVCMIACNEWLKSVAILQT